MTHVLLPGAIAAAMRESGVSWGHLDLRGDTVEDLIVVAGFSKRTDSRRPFAHDWLRGHYTAHVSVTHGAGVWYRSTPELHELGHETRARHASLPTQAFRERVESWVIPPLDRPLFAITMAALPEAGDDFAGWLVSRESASFHPVEVVDADADLFDPLGDGWPRAALAGKLVTVVGCGSIGSAAAEALSAYAIRRLALVDPDRFHAHNFARHRANRNQVGRLKVNALADMLTARDRDLAAERLPLDVIEDADVMRPLFVRSACILVASDGIASRRAANHLACRASVPIVLACVLEDGRLGELIRVRPGRTACLLCAREQLAASGRINPEPALDRGYGTGSRHLAMTAVGGDLDIVGRLAARAVVATMLEQEGYLSERLPGDHGVIGLRPVIDREPEEPFDVERSLQISWHSLGTPSPGCPSCQQKP